MASGFGVVGSVLTEKPPSDSPWATPAPAAYGPLTARTAAPSPMPLPQPTGDRSWYDSLLGGREYEVVYDDADGYPLLALARASGTTSPRSRRGRCPCVSRCVATPPGPVPSSRPCACGCEATRTTSVRSSWPPNWPSPSASSPATPSPRSPEPGTHDLRCSRGSTRVGRARACKPLA